MTAVSTTFAIDANTEHPFYAIDLEVLCGLRRYLLWTPLAPLCRDFGFKTQRELKQVFARLHLSRGIRIEVHQLLQHEGEGLGPNGTVAKGLGARVEPSCWRDAKAIGQAYWEKVNPDDDYTRQYASRLACTRRVREVVAYEHAAQMPGV